MSIKDISALHSTRTFPFPLLLLFCCLWLTGARQQPANQRVLTAAAPAVRELDLEQTHAYQILLDAGSYVEVVIEQRGIDVALTFSAPNNQKLADINRARGNSGVERLAFVADVAGSYLLEIRAAEKNAAPGRYEVKIEALRLATAEERTLEEARRLAEQARGLRQQGKYNEALTLAERALAAREQVLGAQHLAVAEALYQLASIHDDKEDYAKAEPLFQRSLTLREQLLGSPHPDVARSLNSLAWIASVKQDFARAEAFYRRALAIQEQALGTEHSEVGTTLNDLALLYYEKGDYDQAIAVNQRVLAIREKTAGPESEVVARALNNLALAWEGKGAYAEAEALLRRALPLWEQALGRDHPGVAPTLDNLARTAQGQAHYAEAEAFYLRALAIREKAFGSEHHRVADTLHNLATLLVLKGDYEKASELLQRSALLSEKSFGPDHPYVASSLAHLAQVYMNQGRYAQAEPLLRRVLAIREKTRPDHPEVASSLNQLGRLSWQYQQDYVSAEAYFQRALALLEKAFGAEQYPVTRSLTGLAELYESRGDYPQATQFYRRTLAIQEQALGAEHPEVAQTLAQLARLMGRQGELEQSVTLLERAYETRERNFMRHLPHGSERQQFSYLKLFAADTDQALSLHAQAAPRDERALRLALLTLLRRKGRGLDAMSDNLAALRQRASAPDQALFNQLIETRTQLASLALSQSGQETATYRTRFRQLETETERLEAEIGSRSAAFRAASRPITLASVQSLIPSRAMLIEFALYRPAQGAARYAAYLLAAQGAPQWVDLGAAAPLDEAINHWRAALREPKRTDTARLGRAVSALLLQPLQPLLTGAQHLLISPDGALNLIPFEALPDAAGRFLVERCAISYLTSGRDLLRLQEARASQQPPLVIADPLFGEPGAQASATSIVSIGALQRRRSVTVGNELKETYFAPLFATAQEARAIKSLFAETTVLTGAQATEAALKQVNAPRLLHIATHGFFLTDASQQSNPLLRSGLALAQANLRSANLTGEDGILTALEAAGLNLWGTQLVTLSACDTGLGEVRHGEGVYGLRRAFALAGAETLVMSLWPVSDQVTRELMAAYYLNLQRGQGRGAALRAAQLQLLKQPGRRAPYYWASFIQAGQWSALKGQP